MPHKGPRCRGGGELWRVFFLGWQSQIAELTAVYVGGDWLAAATPNAASLECLRNSRGELSWHVVWLRLSGLLFFARKTIGYTRIVVVANPAFVSHHQIHEEVGEVGAQQQQLAD